MNKSKIEWCDYTWNPVTGCLHGCEYCYARKIACRFQGTSVKDFGINKSALDQKPWEVIDGPRKVRELHERMHYESKTGKSVVDSFPFGFDPTFHPYRLNEPTTEKNPSKVFVCSMADLFGEWVPDEWIADVVDSMCKAKQHTYIFLTKNPRRYKWIAYAKQALRGLKVLFGATITNINDYMNLPVGFDLLKHNFLSIEPLLGSCDGVDFSKLSWVIVGAQTGTGAVKPKPEWVQEIVDQCKEADVPLFLKDNLKWPEIIKEWPRG